MSARLNRGLFSYFLHGAESALVTLHIPFDDNGEGAELADLVLGNSTSLAEAIACMIGTVIRVHAYTQLHPTAVKRKQMLDTWLCVLSELAKRDHMLAVAGSIEHGPYFMATSAQPRTETTDEQFKADLPEMITWLNEQYESRCGGTR